MRQHQGGHGVVAATITDPTKIEGIDAALLKRWFGKVKDARPITSTIPLTRSPNCGARPARHGRVPAITEVRLRRQCTANPPLYPLQ